jgi:hypothetical protein
MTARRSREQSSISFPYVDLSAAVGIARAIYDRRGTSPCDLNELAGDLNESVGGAFRLKTSAARIFDLVEKRGRSEVQLTDSGIAVIEKDGELNPRADAFLSVPLYAAIFHKYHDRKLPQRHMLEDEMRDLGVPTKQVDKARQVFERSARQAGVLDIRDNRLVRPDSAAPQIRNNSRIAPDAMMDTDNRVASRSASEAALLANARHTDPLIVGLVDRLPAAGSAWTDAERVAWLRLASSIFDVTYTLGTGHIEIRASTVDPVSEADLKSGVA